ncbi:MAG TPA: N-acetylmuramoyl-L-alanine amidase [Roseiflexaceae bacterium]|nr:N-acetylmuramoyl-L-alanine amidase [Roseiflexaceae bacterium]
MQINKVGMNRNHFEPGDISRVRMVVMHSTAARGPGDFNYLRNGGSDSRPVSIHYYIGKNGAISQMVDDKNIAWQAGASSWKVDGRVVKGCNPISIGIELENLNTGRDPYPAAQYNAAVELTRYLVSRYNIPRNQLVRHLDIAPRRKTDPAGFPWARFVDEVYGTGPAPTPPPDQPAVAAPTPQPLQPQPQLRKLLVDLAYRAAGGAHPTAWPLLKESISKSTGMPIAVITPPPAGDGQGEEDQQRAMSVAGQLLILEAYGRDLFYAAPDTLEQVQRLSATAAGPLRDALLQTLFQSVDPVKGFRPDQAFHQFYLNHMTEIGVPIGPDHILPGGKISCQHYALDTLIWTGKVTRLSELTRAMYSGDPHPQQEKDLRTAVLNDLYNARTGRNFDPTALFCRYAINNGMGAPMGKAEIQTLGGIRIVAMPYALDVLYCNIPADGDWSKIVIAEMPAVLSDDEAQPSQLSALLAAGDVDEDNPMVLSDEDEVLPKRIFRGGLLGVESDAPAITDLTESVGARTGRDGAAVELVVVYPTAGPAGADLVEVGKPKGKRYHYYVDTSGGVLRLVDEALSARAAGRATWQSQGKIDKRSIAIGVENGLAHMSEQQAAALRWLLEDLRGRHNLSSSQIVQAAEFGVGESMPSWDQLTPA